MTTAAWLHAAPEDADRRGLPELKPLLESPRVAANCRTIAAKLADNTALDDTAQLMESLLP